MKKIILILAFLFVLLETSSVPNVQASIVIPENVPYEYNGHTYTSAIAVLNTLNGYTNIFYCEEDVYAGATTDNRYFSWRCGVSEQYNHYIIRTYDPDGYLVSNNESQDWGKVTSGGDTGTGFSSSTLKTSIPIYDQPNWWEEPKTSIRFGANFNLPLIVIRSPEAGGYVVGLDNAISCGNGSSLCQINVNLNDYVTLEAYPEDGYAFAYWDDGSSQITGNPHMFTVNGASSVTAVFFRTFRNAVGDFYQSSGYFGQCLDYVEYETEIPDDVCVGDAGDCYDQADVAGYAVGSIPREGAIVVFAKVPNTSLSHGHVGIVKSYDAANNKIIIHESNWCSNDCETVGEHEEVLGTHTIIGYIYYTP